MPNQNHLKNESSPYLLQHAGNPVDWYPWGDEALQRAKREDKLMVISIGYAACHWCHVMEKESFEDTQVAELMNRFYVSIKVDREERPDIDQIYMTAAQLISGRGGWPLNVITLPDGRPIYAGTYFPKNNWLDVLIKVSQYYRAQRKEALEIAANITDGIQRSELVDLTNEKSDFKTDDLIKSFHNWKQTIDFEWGGSDHAPKFPMPAALNFLLIYAKKSEDKDASTAIKLTLDKMAIGGIYDQIGGGFARYSVDRFWIVPHFEKMLYDNGQLLSVYADAYRYSQSELYRLVLEETIAFANRELRSKDQLYFSSLDADSEGEEGKFYVWRQSELDLTLGDDSQLVSSYYSCTVHGNWENAVNILYRKQSDEQFIELNGLDANRFKQTIESAKQKLLNERDKRIRPGLDDKILTAWNAMMIRGLCDAYRATGDRDYLDSAERTMSALLKFQWRTDGGLNRNFKNGKSSINGFLDDYAFLIDSLIALYQLTFNPDYLEKSGRLINYTIEHFFDKDRMMFYYSSDLDPQLISRKMELQDNVIPSSNAVMALNLLLFSELTDQSNYRSIAETMTMAMKKHVIDHGQYYAKWAQVMLLLSETPYVIAIVGDKCREILTEFDRHFLPNVIFTGSQTERNSPLLKDKYQNGKTIIYVCQNKTCQLPVTRVEDALNQIH